MHGVSSVIYQGIAATMAALVATAALAKSESVASPDGDLAIRIEQDASRFLVLRNGETVIAPSALGLELDGAPELTDLLLEKREDVTVDRTIPLIATKAASARDHYNGATLTFREKAAAARRLLIDVRAYDDGVAFRYRIDDSTPVRLRGERTAFALAGNSACIVTQTNDAHEMQFETLTVSQLRSDIGYDVPVVCATPSGRTHFAITQAHLDGYTGASLRREGEALRVRLSAVPNRSGPAFVSKRGLTTPWRVVMMGDRAGDMIASHIIGNLNPPPTEDFSWVKPGKTAWDWVVRATCWRKAGYGDLPPLHRFRRGFRVPVLLDRCRLVVGRRPLL